MHEICQFCPFSFKKIIKIIATKSHLLRLKCTKFDFGWGSASDPAGEAHSAPPNPQLDFRGILLRERKGEEKKKTEGGREGGDKRGMGAEEKGEGRRGERRRGPKIEISAYATESHILR